MGHLWDHYEESYWKPWNLCKISIDFEIDFKPSPFWPIKNDKSYSNESHFLRVCKLSSARGSSDGAVGWRRTECSQVCAARYACSARTHQQYSHGSASCMGSSRRQRVPARVLPRARRKEGSGEPLVFDCPGRISFTIIIFTSVLCTVLLVIWIELYLSTGIRDKFLSCGNSDRWLIESS